MQVHKRPFGVAAIVDWGVVEVDGVDLRVDWVPATGDVKVRKDNGAEANVATLPADEGQTYSQALSAAELEAWRTVLVAVDSATKVFLDTVIIIDTVPDGAISYGVFAASSTVSALKLGASAPATGDLVADQCYIVILNGAAKNETAVCNGWDGTDFTPEVNLANAPASGDFWVIYPKPPDQGSVSISSGGIPVGAFANNSITAAAAADDFIDEINAALPKKNVALANLPVNMVLTSDHVSAATGLTLGITRSIDGGAFGAGTGTAAEIANGAYQYDASAADMNGDMIIFRFTGTAADDRFIIVKTRP